MSKRVELPDGQWVDIVERLNHAQRQRIRFAPRDGLDNVSEGIAAALVAWHVRDVDGATIPVPADRSVAGFPAAVLDPFPVDIVDALAEAVVDVVTASVPKAGPGPSPGSPTEEPPRSMTASGISTSSPIIPGGNGTISNPPPSMSLKA